MRQLVFTFGDQTVTIPNYAYNYYLTEIMEGKYELNTVEMEPPITPREQLKRDLTFWLPDSEGMLHNCLVNSGNMGKQVQVRA